MSKNKRQPESVKIPRLLYSEKEVDFLVGMLTHPDLESAFSDDDCGRLAIYRTIENLRAGHLQVYAPIIDGEAAGLIWANYMLPGLVTGMWGFLKEKRYGAVAALKLALADMFKTMDCKMIMAFIANNNRQSYAGCYAAGFRPIGEIPGFMTIKGAPTNSTIMVIKEA